MNEFFTCTFRKGDAFDAMPELHSHSSYELYYLVSGERRYFIQDTVFTVHAKGFVFIKPGLYHKTSFSGHGIHMRYFALVPESWFSKWDEALPPFFLSENMAELEYAFSRLQKESEEDGKLNSMMCRAISMEILAQAFRAYQRGQGGTDELIRAVSTYVRENIRSSLSLYDIAKHIGLSAPYLSSLFHQKSGMRLSDFIRSTRISVAADILRSGGRVADASDEAGFSDPSYFKDVFRAVMKISPSAYRKTFRNGINREG